MPIPETKYFCLKNDIEPQLLQNEEKKNEEGEEIKVEELLDDLKNIEEQKENNSKENNINITEEEKVNVYSKKTLRK